MGQGAFDHENRKTPISKPAANAHRPNVQAETTRTRFRRSCGISWDRCVIAAPLRWPLARYGAVTLLPIRAQKKAIDDHGGSRFAPDQSQCPISSYGQGFLDTECEKSFICRHNSQFNAGAVENATCTCAHLPSRRGDRINCQLLQCMSPVVALCEHSSCVEQCPGSGAKRKICAPTEFFSV
jgi:hypothetical protein